MELERHQLEQALGALGQTLTDRHLHYELVAIGGSSLLLMGLITRPTKDLDIVAIIREGHMTSAPQLPEPLVGAVKSVALAYGLDEDWVNTGPQQLVDYGLPEGFAERLESRAFGGLVLHLAAREDQICFKLYAAADKTHPRHLDDLERMEPSRDELLIAARWAMTHDTSEPFRRELVKTMEGVGVSDAESAL